MSKLTDTQQIILSAASQRDDRGVELPANLKGGAARKVVDKLIRAGLLEEVRAAGALPVWRRDDDSGPMALRITKTGRERSGSVTVPGTKRALGSCPAGCMAEVGLWCGGERRRTNAMEDPDVKT
jgi:hypothetical protein